MTECLKYQSSAWFVPMRNLAVGFHTQVKVVDTVMATSNGGPPKLKGGKASGTGISLRSDS
jgi:hypothetical protein